MNLTREQIEGWKMNNGSMSPNEFRALCDVALSLNEFMRLYEDGKLGTDPEVIAAYNEAVCPSSAPSSDALTSVWSVENKTSRVLFATEAAAKKYVSSFPTSVSGGMTWTELPVLGTTSATRRTAPGFHCKSPHGLCSVQCDECAKEQE